MTLESLEKTLLYLNNQMEAVCKDKNIKGEDEANILHSLRIAYSNILDKKIEQENFLIKLSRTDLTAYNLFNKSAGNGK
jgi:hypothetical protein